MEAVSDPHQNCMDLPAYLSATYKIIPSDSKKEEVQNAPPEVVDIEIWNQTTEDDLQKLLIIIQCDPLPGSE